MLLTRRKTLIRQAGFISKLSEHGCPRVSVPAHRFPSSPPHAHATGLAARSGNKCRDNPAHRPAPLGGRRTPSPTPVPELPCFTASLCEQARGRPKALPRGWATRPGRDGNAKGSGGAPPPPALAPGPARPLPELGRPRPRGRSRRGTQLAARHPGRLTAATRDPPTPNAHASLPQRRWASLPRGGAGGSDVPRPLPAVARSPAWGEVGGGGAGSRARVFPGAAGSRWPLPRGCQATSLVRF